MASIDLATSAEFKDTGCRTSWGELNRLTSFAISSEVEMTSAWRSVHALVTFFRMVIIPGRPGISVGGKYVPPAIGFPAGVRKIDNGQPPP